MIKQLSLTNFQSHKKTELEFSDGVNVIIGASDSGKTSIIRALEKLRSNRPLGKAFRSTWGGDTIIETKTDNNTISRIIKDNEDKYLLNKLPFKAFGTEVPTEIIQALNLNEINLQSQMDSPFLISSTPGDVAKHFNKIAHLDQIDGGLKTIQQWINGIKQDIHSGESQINQSKEELKKFVHLEKFEVDVEVLEEMQNDFLKKINNARELKTTIETIETNQGDIDSKSEILQAEPLLNQILGWYTEKKYAEESLEELGAKIEELKELNTNIEEYTYIVSAEKSVTALLVMFAEKTELGDLSQSLGKLIHNITHTENALQTALKQVEKLETEFEENFPELCPLCGQPIKKK